MSNIDEKNKKVRFILAWYNAEKAKLDDGKKLKLLNKWIYSCAKFEEFEMSNALLNEKRKLVRKIRLARVGERTVFRRYMLLLRIAIRKIRNP
jgi:hypothetical protein